MIESILPLLINIVIAAAILFGGIWIAKRLKKYIVVIMEKRKIDALLASFTSNIAYVALSPLLSLPR